MYSFKMSTFLSVRSEKVEGGLRHVKGHLGDAGREGRSHERSQNVHPEAPPCIRVPPAALCGPDDAFVTAVLGD